MATTWKYKNQWWLLTSNGVWYVNEPDSGDLWTRDDAPREVKQTWAWWFRWKTGVNKSDIAWLEAREVDGRGQDLEYFWWSPTDRILTHKMEDLPHFDTKGEKIEHDKYLWDAEENAAEIAKELFPKTE